MHLLNKILLFHCDEILDLPFQQYVHLWNEISELDQSQLNKPEINFFKNEFGMIKYVFISNFIEDKQKFGEIIIYGRPLTHCKMVLKNFNHLLGSK